MQPTPWTSSGRASGDLGPHLVDPVAGQDSNLRVRERVTEWGVCPSNLVREIVSSGRTPLQARMDGMGLFQGKASAEITRPGLIFNLA